MENNDYDTEDVSSTSTEDVNIETNEGAEDTKDWRAEALKYKAIAERKDKKLQASGGPDVEIIKNNVEQGATTIEHSYLFAQGLEIDHVKEVEKFARNEGVSLTEAYKDEYVQNKIKTMKNEQAIKANSMGASNGSAPLAREKAIGQMSDAEHRAKFAPLLANAVNK